MAKKHYKIGYTAGTYDMFHIGHLNILENAKSQCDFLIVAVSTDELVLNYKHHLPIISFEERARIISAIKFVDKVIPQTTMDKLSAALENNVDVIFVGDDWKGTDSWNKLEAELANYNIDVVYLPHTDGISSTIIRTKIKGIN